MTAKDPGGLEPIPPGVLTVVRCNTGSRQMNKWLVAASLAALSALPASPRAEPFSGGDAVRQLFILAQPQAAAPQEYQAAEMVAEAWKALGVRAQVRPLPGQQFNQVIWYERQRWDATTWQMVGRPERSDPDELTYNLFVSSQCRERL